MTFEEKIAEAVRFLEDHRVAGRFDCAFVLGTGLGHIAEVMSDVVSLSYADIPHFPVAGVSGHEGTLLAGRAEGRRILVFQGRAHYYERGEAAAMQVPLGVVAALGAPPLVLTNACGSVRLDLHPGSHVLLQDHINYSGLNPLIGERDDKRFVPMNDAYDEHLRGMLKRAASSAGIALNEGVYMWFSGPSFETAAEVRMARILGADLVGMSTVPEVILARYYGLRVAAVSLVTNFATGVRLSDDPHSHTDTRAQSVAAAPTSRRLLTTFLASLDDV